MRELFHQRDVRDIVERALGGEAVVDRETLIGERVVLFTSTSVRPTTSGSQVDVPEPLLLLGEGIPITADLRPLVDDLSSHAHGIVTEQARRTAAER